MGSIINAKCSCGYEVRLMPGEGECFRRSMAYSKQGYEVDTFEDRYIESEELIRIVDPFDDDVKFDGWGQFVKIGDQGELFLSDEEKRLDVIPCPRCKKRSLYLISEGWWD